MISDMLKLAARDAAEKGIGKILKENLGTPLTEEMIKVVIDFTGDIFILGVEQGPTILKIDDILTKVRKEVENGMVEDELPKT